jgi:tRNA (cytidine/uridine-2'-O-)-methyltransferase
MNTMLHVALYQPAIPQNTGNIGRLCVGMGAHLHIIQPTVFELNDKTLRRAGLDYWGDLTHVVHADADAFLDWLGEREPWLITKFGQVRFDEAAYCDGDVLILGNENTGLPEEWHERWPERRVFIPIHGPIRSYNIANTAAIVLAQGMIRLNGG